MLRASGSILADESNWTFVPPLMDVALGSVLANKSEWVNARLGLEFLRVDALAYLARFGVLTIIMRVMKFTTAREYGAVVVILSEAFFVPDVYFSEVALG